MKLRKKLTSLFSAAAMTITLLSVVSIEVSAVHANYAWKQNQFVISTFRAVPGTVNDYFEAYLSKTKEANITHIETTFTSGAASLEAINICDQIGLKVIVQDTSLFGGQHDTHVSNITEESAEYAVSLYGTHPSLEGYYIWEEPYQPQFSRVRNDMDLMSKYDLNRLMMTNMQQSASADYKWSDGTFKDYVDDFIDIVDPQIISSDYYYFLDIDQGVPMHNLGFWNDIAYLRLKSLETGKPLWYYVQLVGDVPNNEPGNMTIDKVRHQVYTMLTHGCKGISYYNAFGGLFDQYGNETFLFEGVKQLNSEVLMLGKTLVNLTSTLIYHTGTLNCNFDDSISDSQIVSTAPSGLEIGEFESEYGGKYIMFTNRNYTSGLSGTVALKNYFNIYKVNKSTGLVDLVSANANTLSLNLLAGEGDLYVFTGTGDKPPHDFANGPVIRKYNFENDTEGWNAPQFLLDANQVQITRENGALKCKMLTDWRPIAVQKFIGKQVNGSVYDTLHIRLKNPTAATQAQIGFGYASDPFMSNLENPNYNIPFTITPYDTDYKDYYIKLSDNENWASKKDINFLRIQLCLDAVTLNHSVYIDAINLFSNPLAEEEYTFDSDKQGWDAPYFCIQQGLLEISHENSALKCKMLTTWKPVFIQSYLNNQIAGALYDTVHLRIKNPTAATQGQISFSYAADATMASLEDPDYTVAFTMSAYDSEYQDYYINMKSNSKWNSRHDINFVRIQLCADTVTLNASVYVDTIEIYNTPPDIVYEFTTGMEGWDAPQFILNENQLAISQENGALKCQMLTGWRPITVQKFLPKKISGSVYNGIHIRIKNPTAATQAQIGFGFESDPLMQTLDNPAYNIPFTISSYDSVYKDYYINLSDNPYWRSKNDIIFVRIQLCLDTVTIYQSVYIDSVRLCELR